MNASEFMVETEVQAQPLIRATVLRVRANGTVSCSTDDGNSRVLASVLQGSGPPLLLVPKDEVLIWLSGPGGQRGVILGRIGPSHASFPKPQEPPDELVIEAKQNLTIKCGEGSITLRADGKILIKGKDLVSHAQRMNRIKGGGVAIN